MKCNICKDEVKDVYKCDGCQIPICRGCGSLTSSETKVLQLNSRVMKFFCTKCNKKDIITVFKDMIKAKDQLCESKDKIIENKDKIILDKEEVIYLLKKEIESLKGKGNQESIKGYSAAVKRNLSTEVLLVKPKLAQASSATRQAIEDKIDPSTLGVGINGIKYVSDGGVAISCNKQEDIKNISENIQQELGEEYEVKYPEKKNPKIKIFNIEKKMLEDSNILIDKIIIQNTIDTPVNQRIMKILGKYQNKNGKMNVIMEVDVNTYKKIAQKNVLHIGWRSCKYVNHINIIQCYRCWKYGHMARECKKDKDICSKCAGEHKFNSCQSEEEICINCKHASEVLKIPNVNYHHRAIDRKCEAYKRVYKQLEQKINYPEVYNDRSQ